MPILLNQMVYRLTAAPSANLPFGVRSTGHCKSRPSYASRKKTISFVQLFWCVRGSGIIDFKGHPRALKQNQIALYYPNARHYWHASRQYWEFYFLTLDGPFAASLTASFGFKTGIYDAGPAPVALFQTLYHLIGQPYYNAELRACATAFAILTQAAGLHADLTDELVKQAVKRMHQEYNRPTFNIKTLANDLGVQRSMFCVRFQDVTRVPSGVYLERLRMQKALALLRHVPHFPVALVAFRSGYTDANYFSRAFRRFTGYSPLQFRNICKQRSRLGESELSPLRSQNIRDKGLTGFFHPTSRG